MPIARWALIVTIVLMGVAMLVTSGTTLSEVQGASETLERGQADSIEHSVRGALRELGQWPVDEDLSEIVTAGAPQGLAYLAVFDPSTGQISRAGAPAGPAADFQAGVPPVGTPLPVGHRVRMAFHALLKRGGGTAGDPARAGPRLDVLFEFVPLEARQLRVAAARTFRVAAVAAFMLAALALALFRRVLRHEAIAIELERSRRLASLGELSAVLAHEIRNPLASLKGNAQLLASLLPSGDKPRAKADRVVEEAIRLENLVGDLLEFARTGQLARLPRSPAGLLAEAVESLSSERIILDVARAPSSWSLDGARMVQALANLLENALQAGAPVRASVSLAAGQLVFEVRDSGPGVPDEDKQRIFEPFYTRRTRGTGLGLAVARRIVEMHGGRISVTDAPTGGAVFRITLPPGDGGGARASAS